MQNICDYLTLLPTVSHHQNKQTPLKNNNIVDRNPKGCGYRRLNSALRVTLGLGKQTVRFNVTEDLRWHHCPLFHFLLQRKKSAQFPFVHLLVFPPKENEVRMWVDGDEARGREGLKKTMEMKEMALSQSEKQLATSPLGSAIRHASWRRWQLITKAPLNTMPSSLSVCSCMGKLITAFPSKTF